MHPQKVNNTDIPDICTLRFFFHNMLRLLFTAVEMCPHWPTTNPATVTAGIPASAVKESAAAMDWPWKNNSGSMLRNDDQPRSHNVQSDAEYRLYRTS